MIPGRGKPLTQEVSESGKHSPLMLFDCRGYEPIEYVFSGDWKAESVSLSLSPTPFSLHFFHSFLIEQDKLRIFWCMQDCYMLSYWTWKRPCEWVNIPLHLIWSCQQGLRANLFFLFSHLGPNLLLCWAYYSHFLPYFIFHCNVALIWSSSIVFAFAFFLA